MGLLTPTPPTWHPAPPVLRSAVATAVEACRDSEWPGGLVDVALGYAMREDALFDNDKERESIARSGDIPVVIGLSTPAEVHDAVRTWREVHRDDASSIAKRQEMEKKVISIFKESGFRGWAWASPPSKA